MQQWRSYGGSWGIMGGIMGGSWGIMGDHGGINDPPICVGVFLLLFYLFLCSLRIIII